MNTNAIPYSVNNSASIANGSFNRIGYYMELQTASSKLYYMYVSFNAAPFSTQANMLGVPVNSTGEFYHYGGATGQVQNMDIVTNLPGFSNYTGLSSGLVQFWPSNYGNGNGYGVPNQTAGQWGPGDDGAGLGAGYGSMKIASDGVGGGPNTMLMAFNDWNGGTYDVGLGNGANASTYFGTANYNSDYTFSADNANFTIKNLQIVVGNAGVAPG